MAGETATTRRLLAGAMASAAVLAATRPAHAHAVLEASTPAANAVVDAGTVAFRLQFNSRIDATRSRLRLVAPGGGETPLAIKPDAANVLTATATLAAGAYRLRWQVLAVDGHITHGALAFKVRAR